MQAFENSSADPADEVISTINIVPFVDIVLVLLIIFMLTSTAIVKASMTVDLPKAANVGQSVETTLNVVMSKNGELFLNGEPTSREELAATTRAQSRVNPKLQAVVAADKISEYGRVIGIIDMLKQNGVATFALNVERDLHAGTDG